MKEPRLLPHRSYMPGLDGLRALAVIAVMVYHLNSDWLPGGFLGVAVFFTLSGYLITDILVSEWESRRKLDLKAFWIRRARRLLPAMLTVVAAVLLASLFLDSSRFTALRGDIPAALMYMSNWWFIFHKVSYFESFGPPSPLGHLWSLAVEEQFYLIWPLLLIGFQRIRSRNTRALCIAGLALVSALLMAVLYVPGSDPSRVYYGTDTRGFALLVGAALAVVWPSRKLSKGVLSRPAKILLEAAGAASLLGLISLFWTQNEYDPFLYEGGLLLIALLSALLIAALAHPASQLARWMGSRPLRWLGSRSYGLYLWHFPVIALTVPSTAADGVNPLRAIGQLSATVLLAALSYKYIEEPVRRNGFRQTAAAYFVNRHGQTPNRRKPFPAIAAFALFVCALAGGINLYAIPTHAVQENSDVVSGSKTVTMPEIHGVAPAGPAAPVSSSPADGAAGTKPDYSSPSAEAPSSQAGTAHANGKSGEALNPAAGGKTPGQENTPPRPAHDGKGVTAIGDSVMLDIEPYLQKALPKAVIDGKVGRQMSEAQGLVEQLDKKGQLGSIVIIELGTNGAFSNSKLSKLLDRLSDASHIFLINTRVPRPWEKQVNRALADAASKDDRITLIDWHAASSGKTSYFEKDGVHLKPAGAKAYAALLTDALSRLAP